MSAVAAPARPRTRAALIAGLALYAVMLAWIVLWKLGVPWVGDAAFRVVKVVPFAATAGAGASDPVEAVINVLIFVPLGLYLGLLAPSWPWWRVAAVLAGASLGLEVTQYVLAVGSTNVTDVVTNTAGGLAGLGLLALARRTLEGRAPGRADAVAAGVCWGATALVLAAGLAVVASPLQFGGPPPG